MSKAANLSPLVKVVTVPAPVEEAFRKFTAEMGEWWPLSNATYDPVDTISVMLEGRVGGRYLETHSGKPAKQWGEVIAWEPPHRVVFTRHPNRRPETAQEIEVLFQEQGRDTRVTINETGWERMPERPEDGRKYSDRGWDHALKHYLDYVAGSKK